MPKKPKHLPDKAKWFPSLNIWGLGKMKRNKPVGAWKIWNPEGQLVLEGIFDDHHHIDHCKVYHQNGELARQIDYNEKSNSTTITHIQCGEESKEIFPAYNDIAWKAVARIKGKTAKENGLLNDESTFDYFDREGNKLNIPKRSSINKLKKRSAQTPENETALQALERLRSFLKELKEIHYPYVGELEEEYQPFFYQKVKAKELEEAEYRLGIKLPESYLDFVQQHGLLRFGLESESLNPKRMLAPTELNHLFYWLYDQWEFPEGEYTDLGDEVLKKIICFFQDCEDIQYNAVIAFDYTTLAMEPNIIDGIGCENWNWEEQIGKNGTPNRSTMDRFLSHYVNFLIGETMDL